ncbi:MAG: thiol-activated cytolysin family protein [Bacteroidota bacterium]
MKKQLQFKFIGVLVAAGAMFTLNSCKKDTSPQDGVSFETVLASGGEFASFSNQKILSNVSTSSVPVDSGTWNCTNSTWSVMQGNQDFPLYDPNVSVVYPGSLLQGASLNQATPDVVAVRRGGGTVSIDIINGSNSVYVNVTEVKKSLITQALNDIVNDNNEVMPARFTFQHENVKTKEELALSLGLNVEIVPVTVMANLSFSNNSTLNHYLVVLKQSFYTMSYDIPPSFDDFFDPSVTPLELAKYVSPGNPACYVSDVTYGRVFYLLIESSSSKMEISAAINVSFSNAPVSGNVDASYLSSLDDLSVKVVALGGETQSTFTAINAGSLSSLTNQLGNSADLKAGVPLSYVVRTVYSNKLVKNKLDVEYTINDCQLVP